jgi:uncharacterized protein (UPF0332 family)
MPPLTDARLHLAKSAEFLQAANSNLQAGHHNAATSDAVVSGINAKDAICLKLTGKTTKRDNHLEAVSELKRAGRRGIELSGTLDRLLRLKTKSQYQTVSVTASDAKNAVVWAERLHEAAKQIVNE